MPRIFRIVIPLILLGSLGAQQLPDGAELMKRSKDAAARLRTLQFTGVTAMDMGPSMKMTIESSTAMMNPGKSRSEIKAMGMDMLTVSDGETTWVYSAGAKQYVRKDAALGPGAVMAAMGMSSMPDFTKAKTTEKVIGEETIDVDGQKHECWILETRIDDLAMPGAQGAKMTDGIVKVWLDKKLGLDLRSDISMKMSMPQLTEPMQVKVNIVKKNLRIDEPIDEALFHFTPPPDAKPVENLLAAAVMKAGLTGSAAPTFDVKALDGKSYSLAALKGKPVLLDFWATWCGPCRKSMPAIEKLYSDFKAQGLVVLAVNTGEDREIVAEFLKKSPMIYPVVPGDSAILEGYSVSAYPTFVMIGRDGNVVAHEIGFGGEEVLRGMAEKAGLTAPKK